MIYLIKPWFCIVSQPFVTRWPIIPGRPLFPRHGIATDRRVSCCAVFRKEQETDVVQLVKSKWNRMEIGKRKFVGNVIRSILLEIKLNWGCLRSISGIEERHFSSLRSIGWKCCNYRGGEWLVEVAIDGARIRFEKIIIRLCFLLLSNFFGKFSYECSSCIARLNWLKW